eukprot:scaffold1146_cov399-Prasinococcus_capsulatus_cf.AAC.56
MHPDGHSRTRRRLLLLLGRGLTRFAPLTLRGTIVRPTPRRIHCRARGRCTACRASARRREPPRGCARRLLPGASRPQRPTVSRRHGHRGGEPSTRNARTSAQCERASQHGAPSTPTARRRRRRLRQPMSQPRRVEARDGTRQRQRMERDVRGSAKRGRPGRGRRQAQRDRVPLPPPAASAWSPTAGTFACGASLGTRPETLLSQNRNLECGVGGAPRPAPPLSRDLASYSPSEAVLMRRQALGGGPC